MHCSGGSIGQAFADAIGLRPKFSRDSSRDAASAHLWLFCLRPVARVPDLITGTGVAVVAVGAVGSGRAVSRFVAHPVPMPDAAVVG